MADKDSNYNSIYSTIYSEVWGTNLNTNGFKVGNFTLNGVNYSQKFMDANREYWVHPEHYDFSPFETGNLDFIIYEKNRNGVGVDPNGTKVRFNDMTFPQYFIISDAPDKIQVSSEQDFTVKVANAKYNQTSGFALPQPDALNLYFYTKKGNRNNAFKTPVTFIPTPGGEQFSFTYPGKNVKYDYSVNYFDLGEGASVVKAAKSYEEILNLKGVRVRCLITFVNIAERTYQYVP